MQPVCLSACDLADRGMDSPVSLERYGETINQKMLSVLKTLFWSVPLDGV